MKPGRLLGGLLLTALALPAAAAEPDCSALVKTVTAMAQEDSRVLAQVRGKLQQARELCESGKSEEAVALLKDIQDNWTPMGMGR